MPPGASILLAVSGGADSMALLSGCAELAPETGWRLDGRARPPRPARARSRPRPLLRRGARPPARSPLPRAPRRRARRRAAAAALAGGGGPPPALRGALEMAREAGASRIATAHQRTTSRSRTAGPRGDGAELARLAGPREKRRGRRRAAAARRLAGRDPRLPRRARHLVSAATPRTATSASTATASGARSPPAPADRRERLVASAADTPPPATRLDEEFERRVRPRLALRAGRDARRRRRSSPPVPREPGAPRDLEARGALRPPGHPSFTGGSASAILDRLAGGADFRFEAAAASGSSAAAACSRVAGSPAPRRPRPAGCRISGSKPAQDEWTRRALRDVSRPSGSPRASPKSRGRLDEDFRGRPVVLLSILKGAAFFAADLARQMRRPPRSSTSACAAPRATRSSRSTSPPDSTRRQGRRPPQGRRQHGRHRDLPLGPAPRRAASRASGSPRSSTSPTSAGPT